ncbi:ammonium transporter, partial [Salibacterium salarium]
KSLTGGLRVSEEEEIMGLDMSEHGSYGYPESVNPQSSTSTNTGA